MDFNLLLSSYAAVWSNPEVILMTFIGALGGVLLGAIPGMTATMGVALLIPFSFGMDLIPSIGLLLGIYCGGMYGGSISAILIHAPGTPAAAATLLDGYPMCKKGQAGKALSVAMFASFCGGVIGALVMTFLSPLVADMAMNFGPGEMFMLAVFGLSVIVAISGKSVAKGLISAFFGMLLCTVGLDPTNGIPRFITTKQTGLLDGFQFIPTLIGLFAVSEVIAGVERIIRGEEQEQKSKEKITNVLPDLKTIRQIWPNILSGGLIGTFIGAIPGAGGDIAVFVSYGASKSASKHPELYGTGIPNGVAATESANNGCSGGAMIPLLSLGVPGDSVTAILLGAFIMKGITPGPMMYVTELPTVYRVFAALMLANLCMLAVGCLGVRFFAKIVSVEKKMLYPIILVISLLGAFSINKNAFDVGVCVAFGIIGWLMNKYEFPLSPILLALILGPMCEKNFVRYMNIQRGNFFAITTSPIAMVFAAVAILVIVFSMYNQSKELSEENAAQTAKALNIIQPDFIRVHATGIKPESKLGEFVRNGSFALQSEEEIVVEQKLFLQQLHEMDSYYVNEHIVNLLLEIRGNLRTEKQEMLSTIDRFLTLPPDERLLFAVGRRLNIFFRLDDLKKPKLHQKTEKSLQQILSKNPHVDFAALCNYVRQSQI